MHIYIYTCTYWVKHDFPLSTESCFSPSSREEVVSASLLSLIACDTRAWAGRVSLVLLAVKLALTEVYTRFLHCSFAFLEQAELQQGCHSFGGGGRLFTRIGGLFGPEAALSGHDDWRQAEVQRCTDHVEGARLPGRGRDQHPT